MREKGLSRDIPSVAFDLARALDLDGLISLLVREHESLRERLSELSAALGREDYLKASELLSGFNPYLKQHIIDEEARVLKVLLAAYGRNGADEAIKVFQEHRVIHNLIEEMQQIASSSPPVLREKRPALDRLLREHFRKEEGRIFPWTLDLAKGKARQASRKSLVNRTNRYNRN